MIIGLSGFIGSGKDTVADYICEKYQFSRESFADSLKDSLSAIFKWDRDLLEGKTTESRKWRETVDDWWSTRLNIENFTPRYAMQYFGTNICRDKFYDDIWVASLEKKILDSSASVIISDVRFLNEIQAIKRLGGYLIRIKRGEEPYWFNTAVMANYGNQQEQNMLKQWNIHPSESSWVGYNFDITVENNGTMDDLRKSIDLVMENLESNPPASTVNLADEVAVDNWHKLF